MESPNSHHHQHQLQDQLVGSSASFGVGITSHANWPPTSFLNSNVYTSSYETRQEENNNLVSMAPYLGSFNWTNMNTTETSFSPDQDLHDQHSRIKEEHLSDHYYRKLLSSTNHEASNEGTKLLLKSFSSGNLMNKIHETSGLCQIFPTINSSSFNQMGLPSSTFDMNLEALDLLTSSNNQTDHGICRDGFSFGFDHHLQQSLQNIPFNYASNIKVSSNAAVDSKRNCNKMEPKLIQNAPKKSRLEARSSCPPFKVRKEKLGDRIAALQQLVAPFGKTDTASVLMEAIGYIKFLQNQVETLSVPYMKASRNKSNRILKGGSSEIEHDEQKRDLKSRGLCLVPLTCLSYITEGGGAAFWPPPHFGGAT